MREFTEICQSGLRRLRRDSVNVSLSERFSLQNFWILFRGIYTYYPGSNSYKIEVKDMNALNYFLCDGSFSTFRGARSKVNVMTCSDDDCGQIMLKSFQNENSYTYKLKIIFSVEH